MASSLKFAVNQGQSVQGPCVHNRKVWQKTKINAVQSWHSIPTSECATRTASVAVTCLLVYKTMTMYQHSSCTCVAKQQPTQNQTKTKPQKPKTVKHQNPSKLPCYLQYPGSTNRIQIQRRWERCSKGNHKFHKESSLTQFGPFHQHTKESCKCSYVNIP